MKNILFQNWTFFRATRLIMGVAILIQAFIVKDFFLGFAGVIFSGMALFNAGCCGSNGCTTRPVNTKNKTKDISYEEVV
jgi:hypothetical protein